MLSHSNSHPASTGLCRSALHHTVCSNSFASIDGWKSGPTDVDNGQFTDEITGSIRLSSLWAAYRVAMPPAARITDMHTCPMVTVLVPHVGGPIIPPCCPTVIVSGMPAARVGDMCICTGPPDVIALGSFTVFIGGMQAARIGDMTAHGGMIVSGAPTVIIGG